MKYYNAMVVFEEIPDEIALAINITNCPCHCRGCHSKFLWDDVGTELTIEELERLLDKNDGITTVCFMGGDATPETVNILAEYIHEIKHLKVGWYSGMDKLSEKIDLQFRENGKLMIKKGCPSAKRWATKKQQWVKTSLIIRDSHPAFMASC